MPGRQRTNAFPNLYVHKEASGDFGVNGPTEAADKLAGSGRNTIDRGMDDTVIECLAGGADLAGRVGV